MGVLKVKSNGVWVPVGMSAIGVQSADYTPVLINFSPGSGGAAENKATYCFVGGPNVGDVGPLTVQGRVVFGTTAPGFPVGATQVTYPPGFNMASFIASQDHVVGECAQRFTSPASAYYGPIWANTINTVRVLTANVAGTYLVATSMSTTAPATFIAGDYILYQFQVIAKRV